MMKDIFNKKVIGSSLTFLLVLGLFIFASYLTDLYAARIQHLVSIGGGMGVLGYIFVTIIAVVVAPVSSLPLLPIATAAWGWFFAGVYSIIGWSIGAQIAFLLARRYGQSFIQRLFSIEKLSSIEALMPTQGMFISVILLRMTLPVDLLSYALGLFTKINANTYFFATLIGIIPFGFVFSYAGTLPVIYQIEAAVALCFVLLVIYSKRSNHL